MPSENACAGNRPKGKRLLDLLCLLLALPAWLPLMGILAAFIKIVSPGPVFFIQPRVGFRGQNFRCLKFRTMKANAETQSHENHLDRLMTEDIPMTKLDSSGDPRLIRCGNFIRASGLDELPQLINVLKGDMSLVGPRPCTPHEFEKYQAWQKERFNAMPGLTGLWQVSGKNETTFTQMVKLDIEYARTQSVFQDLRIMARTFGVLFDQIRQSRPPRPRARRRSLPLPSRSVSGDVRQHGLAGHPVLD